MCQFDMSFLHNKTNRKQTHKSKISNKSDIYKLRKNVLASPSTPYFAGDNSEKLRSTAGCHVYLPGFKALLSLASINLHSLVNRGNGVEQLA